MHELNKYLNEQHLNDLIAMAIQDNVGKYIMWLYIKIIQ